MRRQFAAAVLIAWGLATTSLEGFVAPSAAQAMDAPATQTMLIIDGSGSMWGRFETDNRAKIDAVRDLVKSRIEATPGQAIGLASFGHRRRGDCSDVEVIAPAAIDHAPVLDPLAKLNPRGKGPLVAALRQGIAALGPSRPASLIVVGDGADNCQQDACAAATEIATANPGVPIHMISIGVDPADVPRLSCVSTATGGLFFDVKDASGLTSAIDATAKLAMLSPDAVAEPEVAGGTSVPAAPADSNASVTASVALTENGTAVALPVHWRVLKSGGELVLERDGATLAARLDPGSYDIEAEAARIRVTRKVTIEAGRPVALVLPLNAGRLQVVVKADKASVSFAPIVSLQPMIDGQPSSDGATIGRLSQTPLILPAGAYVATIGDGDVRQSKPVTLSPGADAKVDFTLATGRVELSAALREDGGALDDVTFAISEDDPDSPDGRREVARSRAPTAHFALPAGTYYVSARSGEGEVRQRIAVNVGDAVKQTLILPLVSVKVSALIGGQPAAAGQGIVYRVTALEGDRREITRSVSPEMSLSLLPGRYLIAAHLDAHHLKASQEVAVEPGKSTSVVLKFIAGELSLKPGPQTATPADISWEIIDQAGRAVWRSMVPEPRALLAPGRYTVRLDIRDKRSVAAVEIIAGERKAVQIDAN